MKKIIASFPMITYLLITVLSLGSGFILPGSAVAHPPHPVRGPAHVSVHHGGPGGGHGGPHNTNVNVNVHHNGPGHGGSPSPPDHHVHAGDIVAGAITGLAIGAIVTAASMPPACSDVVVNNTSYRQCGSTWYQPYYAGTQVQYVVVNPPR